MAKVDGVILSHTRMGAQNMGFCTNILIFPTGQPPRQIRPRLAPNDNLFIGSFAFTEAFMNSMWQPGYRVRVDDFISVDPDHRRPTHPEDVALKVVNYWHPLHLQVKMAPADFLKTIQPFVFPNVQALYPPLIRKENAKAYIRADVELVRSVGYVVPKTTTFYLHYNSYKGTNEERVKLIDAAGVEYDLPMKDTQALDNLQQKVWKRNTPYLFSAVRLALAGPIPATAECYLMASHFIP